MKNCTIGAMILAERNFCNWVEKPEKSRNSARIDWLIHSLNISTHK